MFPWVECSLYSACRELHEFVVVFIAIISSGSDDDAFAKCAVKQLAILQPHVKRQLPTEAKLFLVGLPFLFFISKLCLSL